jgi:hypothetical protein
VEYRRYPHLFNASNTTHHHSLHPAASNCSSLHGEGLEDAILMEASDTQEIFHPADDVER